MEFGDPSHLGLHQIVVLMEKRRKGLSIIQGILDQEFRERVGDYLLLMLLEFAKIVQGKLVAKLPYYVRNGR
jgi:hypothetical protein